MKKIYLLSILLCLGVGLFAQVQTKVTKTILPLISTMPVVFQDNVTGGFHQVADNIERNALPAALKEVGMLVLTQDNNACYQWDGTAWQQVTLLKTWATGAAFAIGDKFLYGNSIVTAIAAGTGTIAGGDNPLTMPTVWSSNQSVKTWATGAVAAPGDKFLYGNNVVTNVTGETIAADETPDTNPTNWNYDILPTSKTISIGNGVAAAAQTLNLGAASGDFAHAVNIATGTSNVANTVTIGGAKTNGSLFTTTTGTVNIGDVSPGIGIGTGNSAAAQTIAIGTGNTTGTQDINIGTGSPTGVQTINIGTPNAVNNNVINIGTAWTGTGNLITIGSGTTTIVYPGISSFTSDERLKTNIQTLTGVLAKLEKMRGVSYVFKDQVKYAHGPQVGVIAQELQKVFPELVVTDAKGNLSVNYTQLTAVLLQAVKEQQVEINELKAQMELVMKTLKLKK